MRRSKRTSKLIVQQKWRHNFVKKETQLHWGVVGFRLTSRLRLGSRKLRWYRLLIRQVYSKYYNIYNVKLAKKRKKQSNIQKFKRVYWCYVRKLMPVLKKSSKARMGKGRGKLSGYCGTIGRGAYLFEFATNPNIIMNRLIHRFRHQLGNIFIVITANNTIKFSKWCYDKTQKYVYNQNNFMLTRPLNWSGWIHWQLRKHVYSI